MNIIIETTDNGAHIICDETHLSYDLETEAGDVDVRKRADVLWQIIDLLGWVGSRYDEKRLKITIEPGDKFEGEQHE